MVYTVIMSSAFFLTVRAGQLQLKLAQHNTTPEGAPGDPHLPNPSCQPGQPASLPCIRSSFAEEDRYKESAVMCLKPHAGKNDVPQNLMTPD